MENIVEKVMDYLDERVVILNNLTFVYIFYESWPNYHDCILLFLSYGVILNAFQSGRFKRKNIFLAGVIIIELLIEHFNIPHETWVIFFYIAAKSNLYHAPRGFGDMILTLDDIFVNDEYKKSNEDKRIKEYAKNTIKKVMDFANWTTNQIFVIKNLHSDNIISVFESFIILVLFLMSYYELWQVADIDTFRVDFFHLYILLLFQLFGFTDKYLFWGGLIIIGMADEFNIARTDWVSFWVSAQLHWASSLFSLSTVPFFFSTEAIAKNPFLTYFYIYGGKRFGFKRGIFALLISVKHKIKKLVSRQKIDNLKKSENEITLSGDFTDDEKEFYIAFYSMINANVEIKKEDGRFSVWINNESAIENVSGFVMVCNHTAMLNGVSFEDLPWDWELVPT